MSRSARAALAGAAVLLGQPGVAQAGMPSVSLTDVARLRLQGISFFLAVFLVSAGLVQLLWNRLHRDFPSLPRLSYGKALGVVVLWGLLFVLVLTMISGARELMTPGAWEKQGRTYRLANQGEDAPPADSLETTRRQKLEELRFALWEYARSHGGEFPSTLTAAGIPEERWRVPDPSGIRYVYLGSLTAGKAAPLACEPEVFGPRRFVLFRNGDIRLLDTAAITRALRPSKP
jgi:hypothetical protein